MHVTQKPTVVDVAHDLFDRVESNGRFGGIMHGQHDAGQDLHDQHDRQHGAEGVCIIEVSRHRIGHEAVIYHARQGKPRIDPLFQTGRRLIVGMPAHVLSPHPIRSTVSEANV